MECTATFDNFNPNWGMSSMHCCICYATAAIVMLFKPSCARHADDMTKPYVSSQESMPNLTDIACRLTVTLAMWTRGLPHEADICYTHISLS